MERILITDGEQRSALACVRSLGRAGHECFVVGPDNGSLAARSKYCRGGATCPDASKDPKGFQAFLEKKSADWGISALFPVTEKSLRVILPQRDRFDGVLIPFPETGVFEAVSDKARVMEVAGEIGIHLPRQWVWRTRNEAQPEAIPDNTFPLVVKPSMSVASGSVPRPKAGLRYLTSLPALEEWLATVPDSDFPFLVQERIMGVGAGVFLLTWEGETRAVVGHRRIREKPPSGGVSAVRDSTMVDPDLLDRSMQLLKRLGWKSGVAMVEFKIQTGTGIPYLMEINGRFWGSLQLAINAGVDFPVLLLKNASGDGGEEPILGRPGVRTRWLLGDFDQLLLLLFRSASALDLPVDHPGRARSVLSFLLDFRPGVKLEVLRLGDLKPFFWEIKQWFRDIV